MKNQNHVLRVVKKAVQRAISGKETIFATIDGDLFITNTHWLLRLPAGLWEDLGLPPGQTKFLARKGMPPQTEGGAFFGMDKNLEALLRCTSSTDRTVFPTTLLVEIQKELARLWATSEDDETTVVAVNADCSDLLENVVDENMAVHASSTIPAVAAIENGRVMAVVAAMEHGLTIQGRTLQLPSNRFNQHP